MAPGSRAPAGALKSLQIDLSEHTDPSKISWDTSPMSEMMWLMALPRLLQTHKSIRELVEFGWVLINSKTAVESLLHARYLTMFPDITFDYAFPAPTFSVPAYEAQRGRMIKELDRWHARQATPATADPSGTAQPPFHLQSYLTVDKRAKDFDPDTLHEDINVAALKLDSTTALSDVGLKVEWRLCGTRWVGSGRRSLSSVPTIELFDHTASLCFIPVGRYREGWGRKGVVECDVKEHDQVSGMQY